jgi:hypothetical protein
MMISRPVVKAGVDGWMFVTAFLKTPIPFPKINNIKANFELSVGLTGGSIA